MGRGGFSIRVSHVGFPRRQRLTCPGKWEAHRMPNRKSGKKALFRCKMAAGLPLRVDYLHHVALFQHAVFWRWRFSWHRPEAGRSRMHWQVIRRQIATSGLPGIAGGRHSNLPARAPDNRGRFQLCHVRSVGRGHFDGNDENVSKNRIQSSKVAWYCSGLFRIGIGTNLPALAPTEPCLRFP